MRVLVPLDGSAFAAAILPDALRVSGQGGEIILIRDAGIHQAALLGYVDQKMAYDAVQDYLSALDEELQYEGIKVRTVTPITGDPVRAIIEAARTYQVDMIACSTHGRDPLGRLWRGSIAWHMVSHSPVPVLLRHVEEDEPPSPDPLSQRRILVPLDGSALSERALPLAQKLAEEWHAQIWLTSVVPETWGASPSHIRGLTSPTALDAYLANATLEVREHLQRIGRTLHGHVHVRVLSGPVTQRLIGEVEEEGATDIVMASHGRTGLPRVVLGSVADALVHRLHCPIFVVPALVAQRSQASWSLSQRTPSPSMSSGPGE